MKASFCLLLVFVFCCLFTCMCSVIAKEYSPEISGNLEIGDKKYCQIELDEVDDELQERYYYRRCWLKYKQRLTRYEYYYIKGQYYEKDYIDEVGYNNYSFDLWGNYTFCLNDKMRNRWLLNLRKKDYTYKNCKSYRQLRVKYQIDYDHNVTNDYMFYLQRQWKYLYKLSEIDAIYDRFNFSWDHQLHDNLTINTSLVLDRELHQDSAVSNKYGQKISLGFIWKPEKK